METAFASAARVTVGNTGCPGRQNGVAECWRKLPDVVSVTVLSPLPTDTATQRVFVVVSKETSPSENTLREALGKRAKHYPILNYESE
jgi:hypothetical protein